MLVLSRKRGEIVKIGHNIWVKVLQTGQSTTKIGLIAPRHVSILRDEPVQPEFDKAPYSMKFDGEIS